ncbi:MAG: O-antigen ligase family protein [Deltaproteobacteria bacterium]|nr:MAG: O-antigen ligase family protein [Deltaproteobacteria bacterium]
MGAKITKRKIIKKDDWYPIVPLAFIIGVVPAIVRYIYIPLNDEARRQWAGVDSFAVSISDIMRASGVSAKYWTGIFDSDIFTFWKAAWMIIAAVVLIIVGYVKWSKKEIEIKKTIFYIPIAIYAFFIILSSVMSEYKDLAYFGFPNRHEGMYVLLVYLLISTATIILVNTEKHVKIIIGALVISGLYIGILGFLQCFGYDFMQSDTLVRAFVVPQRFYELGEVKVRVTTIGISSTLYNSNFVGSYMAMLFPILIALILFIKNKYLKIFIGLLSCLVFADLLWSGFNSGLAGFIVGNVILLIMLRRMIMRYWKNSLIIIIVSVVILVFLSGAKMGAGIEMVVSLQDDIQRLFTRESSTNYLLDVFTKSNEVSIVREKSTLKIIHKDGELIFKDKDDHILLPSRALKDSSTIIAFKDELYSDYVFELKSDKTTINLDKPRYGNDPLRFKVTSEGIKFLDASGQPVPLEPVKKLDVRGKESVGSGRGFIWSRAIPMLSDTIFIGKGPGTFAVYFPQKDYIGKILATGHMMRLYDKPHNLFIDIAFSTGMISLMAFLAIVLIYFFSSLGIYFRSKLDNLFSLVGLGIFTGIVSYLISCLANDSAVTVAPVFWILLGLGICMNLLLKKQSGE